MKVTIITDDKTIIIDGVALQIDYEYDESVHAIQWNENTGIVEYKDKPQKKFKDISLIQPYIDVYNIEKASRFTPDELSEQEKQSFNSYVDYELNKIYKQAIPEILTFLSSQKNAPPSLVEIELQAVAKRATRKK